jgi:hypothetical protein
MEPLSKSLLITLSNLPDPTARRQSIGDMTGLVDDVIDVKQLRAAQSP